MNNAVSYYEKMEIWQESIDLSIHIYAITETFPDYEKFGLASQLQRAGVSIPSNIAEGAMKGYKREFCKFMGHSLGSLAEVDTQMIIAHKRGYIDLETYRTIRNDIKRIMKKMFAFLRKLKA